MATYILSDLHLHDEPQPCLFTPEKERVFVRLVDEIVAGGDNLIVAGDLLDLTGMNPPKYGLAEFFSSVLAPQALEAVAAERPETHRALEEQLKAVSARFPLLFNALDRLAVRKSLIMIAGNHDCALKGERGKRAFENVVGAHGKNIQWRETVDLDGVLIAAHGNEYDPANRTEHGCENRGAAITAALYRGAMPALRALGVPEQVVAAIPAVRPEEEIVAGIEHHLGPADTRRFVLAFVRLLYRNGYFEGLSSVLIRLALGKVPLVSELLRAGVTPARLRRALPLDNDLREKARRGARAIQRHRPGARVVVMGHTHLLDWQRNYVNLGTWIDHITGLSPSELKAAELSLPVLRLDEKGQASLRDVSKLIEAGSFSACRELWQAGPVVPN